FMAYYFILFYILCLFLFFFSSRRRHTRFSRDWSSDVCSSDLFLKNKLLPVEQRKLWLIVPFVCLFKEYLYTGLGAKGKTTLKFRSEERRVGKECRSRWSRDH